MTGLERRALLVGVDKSAVYGDLAGCVNDVAAIAPLLARHEDGAPNFDCHLLANAYQGVTLAEFRQGVRQLFAPGARLALLYAACHGADVAGNLVLATSDGTPESPGLAVNEILSVVAQSKVNEVLLILDCCLSGAAGQIPQLGSSVAAIREGITILTAGRDEEPSSETSQQRGLFSTMLCAGLEGGAADVRGHVNIGGLYAYLSECFGPWDQRPMLKANIDHTHLLRQCHPAVPPEELRMLPGLFPTPDHELPLDPSYEPEVEPHDAEHERVFAVLRRARAAKLVRPTGTEHLYFAAMQGKGCRLTPLGRHYRRMAENGWL